MPKIMMFKTEFELETDLLFLCHSPWPAMTNNRILHHLCLDFLAWSFHQLSPPQFISQGQNLTYLIYILNSFSKDLTLYSIYNLSLMQWIINNKNISFDFFSFWRTERIKTSIGTVSITNITIAHGDIMNHEMNSHLVSTMPRNKQMSHPNRLLKLVDIL